MNDDSDADSLSDAEEGVGDADEDGVADYLDPDPAYFDLWFPLILR